MTKNMAEPNTERKVSENRFGISDTRRRPLAGRWWTPDCSNPASEAYASDWDLDGGGGLPCYGWEPDLVNDWAQPSDPLEKYAFRLHKDGSLEFKGHLDASLGAVSGTVAVTLPGFLYPDEPDFRPPNDQYWHTVITPDDGTTFEIALVFIDSTTGDVTITWPAS